MENKVLEYVEYLKKTKGISEKREISWGTVPSLSRAILTD